MSLLNPFERRDSRSMGSTASFIVQGQHLVPNNLISAMEALKNSDLYSVTSLISSDIAGADFIGTNQYVGLLNKPNTLSNKVNFWQTVVLNLLLSGNAFIYLEKNPDGIITNMRPIPSSMVTVDLTDDVLSYDIMAYDTFLGGTASADEMIHARIMAYGESPLDALVGHSPLEALGNEVAQQKEATRLTLSTIKNAINPTSVIQVPEGTLSKEAKNTIRTEFEQANTGENAGRVMVLDQSADFKTIAINADVAKYLTQLDWGRNQITKTFGVPDSYLNGQGDQQSSLDQISSLYVGGLNRYIEPLLSELNFKLGGGIRLDMSQIMDYSKATFKKDISDWVKNGVLTPDEAKELLIRKGGDLVSEKPLERYFVDTNDLETRKAKSSDFIGQIAGYAIKFDKPSVAEAPFTEYVAQTALNGVDMSKVLALYDHDYANILGRVDAGTLALNVDKIGLHFVLDLPDTSLGRDVYANVKAGNLKGMSFGFTVAKGGDVWKRDGKPVRVINKIDSLREISVVSVPAYDDTSVLVTRSLDAFLLGEKEQIYRAKIKELLR